MTDQAVQFIGTNVGGEPDGLESLVSWLGEVESVVEEAGRRLSDMVYDATEVWVGGGGGFQFALQLERGRQSAFDLSDRLGKAVSLVGECAGAMVSSQRRLDDIEEQARDGDLAVHEHRILDPYHTTFDYRQDPSNTDLPEGGMEILQERRERFIELSEAADQAMGPVADKLEEFANEGTWFDGLVFNAGSLVAEETTVLMNHESSRLAGKAQHHGMLERYWNRSRGPGHIPGVHDDFAQFAERHGVLGELAERGSRQAGMVAKLLGGWWATAVISGLELGFGLTGQERDGKTIVQVGAGVAAGAAGTALAAPVIAGATLIPGVGIIAAIGLVGWLASSAAGQAYEEFVPESPRDKLERYS